MKLLALDTAMAACSVAVRDGARITAAEHRAMARGHAEALLPMVEAVMAAAGLAYADLDAIAVTRGPGTFTGLRIGLAAARGLALAAARPLIGLTTLEVLAATVPEGARGGSIMAAIEARRGEVYGQIFSSALAPLCAPAALAAEALAALPWQAPVRVVGDAAPRLLALLGGSGVAVPGAGQPDARVVARLAATRPLPAVGARLSPLYLRAPNARLRAAAAR